MPNFDVLEPAIDPNNRITFLLDWELTMKCNLDCSYCYTDLYYGGHNNSIPHPDCNECIQTIDFMFAYVDQYMMYKPNGIKYVVLNVYGGEALAHPNIVEILEAVHEKYQAYKDRWHLTVTTTTNAILSGKTLNKILPLIDEFTVSYHTENTNKQKQTFKDNLLAIQKNGTRLKCVVLMHEDPDKFQDAQLMIDWLKLNHIKTLPRQLDSDYYMRSNYNTHQVQWFNKLNQDRSNIKIESIDLPDTNETVNLSETGRACCGGRQMCEDLDYKSKKGFILDNRFTDWYCSVNWFFLYVKQVTREVFSNKDCKMNFNGGVGPIGHLDNTTQVLQELEQQLSNKSLPIIQCKKPKCHCGLCAPKAKTLDKYHAIIKKYQRNY